MTIHSPEVSALDISALVSSRICHDLVSPVGAIGNGVELIEALIEDIPEMGLIAESVENAKSKLQFFRLCFGRVSQGAELSPDQVKSLVNAKMATQRLSLSWDIGGDAVAQEKAKLVFLLMLCVDSAMPIGGELSISCSAKGWRIHATATRIQLDDIWSLLSGRRFDGEVTPAQVQFPLALQQCGKLGLQLDVKVSDNSLTISL